jgi:hypothetical protein
MSRRKKIAVVLILAFAIAAGGVAVITLYRLLSPQVSPDGHRPISSRNGAGSGLMPGHRPRAAEITANQPHFDFR